MVLLIHTLRDTRISNKVIQNNNSFIYAKTFYAYHRAYHDDAQSERYKHFEALESTARAKNCAENGGVLFYMASFNQST